MDNLHTDIVERNFSVEEEQKFNFKDLLQQALKNWYLFVLSIAVCVFIAILIGKSTTAIWNITGQIIINDDPTDNASTGGQNPYAALMPVRNNSTNRLDVLTSRTLINKVVKKCQLNVRILGDYRLKAAEIYAEAPFGVVLNNLRSSFSATLLNVEVVNKNQFKVSEKDGQSISGRFGEMLTFPFGQLKLVRSNAFSLGKFKVEIKPEDEAIDDLLANFQAVFTDKYSNSIGLSLNYTEPNRGRAILDTLMNSYLEEDTQHKKRTADSTLKFIDSRVKVVYQDLDSLQSEIKRFKQSHNMVQVDQKLQGLVDGQTEYLNSADNLNTQLRVVNQIEASLNSSKSINIPASVSVNNGALVSNIDSYNSLVNTRIKLKQSGTDDNPYIRNLDEQLRTTRASLLAGLAAYKKSLILSRNQAVRERDSISNKINEMPGIEKEFENFLRQKTIKEALYSFLLQKREELAISNTSTVSNAQIIKHALVERTPVKPVKSKLMVMGFLIGLAMPTAYVVGRELLNKKILRKSDLTSRTLIPIVGEIGHNLSDEALVVKDNAKSIVSEQIRSLRTNLHYVSNLKCNTFLITSTMSGEGKTFLSLNLGNSFALAGKKVVILELDLRKPRLSTTVGLDYKYGYTNFAISETEDIDSITRKIWENVDCYLISSGLIPPNPTELLMHDRLELLLNALKKKYDYIIIDTAPVGAVSDGLLLEKYADVTLYIVRQKYTEKNQIGFINQLANESKIRNPYLVINDIKAEYNNYNYGYNYGYGYGYSEDVPKNDFWSRFRI